MSDLVSLSKATELLKFDGDSRGRKLKRRLQAKEKKLGVKLIELTEGGQERVSLQRLAVVCPDLCPTEERELERSLLKRQEEFERGIEARFVRMFLELEENQTKIFLRRIAMLEERLAVLEGTASVDVGTKVPKENEENSAELSGAASSPSAGAHMGTFASLSDKNFPLSGEKFPK